jgi:hypothetical protein
MSWLAVLAVSDKNKRACSASLQQATRVQKRSQTLDMDRNRYL